MKVIDMISKHIFTAYSLLALLLLGSPAVVANSFSFTGNFTNDADVQFFNFAIAADSTSVTISTLSLNGGINEAGDSIAGGGFNPYVALFNQVDGAWLFDTGSKLLGDEAVISSFGTLLAGNYILALTQLDNVAAGLNLSDGFAANLGLATFSLTPFTANGGGGSGHWAIDMLNVDAANLFVASAPEPLPLNLMLIGLLGLAAITRNKACHSTNLAS
jgi:hypothetical protein